MTTLCQPCEPLGKVLVKKWSRVSHGFYIKSGRWYCPCDKIVYYCVECRNLSEQVDLKIGESMCKHNKQRFTCIDCSGSQVCEHNRQRSHCKQCNGSQICEHNRQRSDCKQCGGSQICKHNIIRSKCKKCNGSQICEHNRRRSQCKKCNGSQICEHNRRRSDCKQCNGSQICEHNKIRSQCKICDPQSYIAHLRRIRRRGVTNSSNPTHTLDDLGMTSKEWYAYLSKTFEDRYGRPRNESDDVHIDEIIPCSAWNIPDDNKYCWHYLNSQWLLAEDNLSKGSSYSQTDKDEMIKRIDIALSEIKTSVSI